MREKRGQLFNRTRFGLEINSKNVQSTLTEILRRELTNLAATDIDPSVNPFSQIVNEPLEPEEALELEAEILNEEGMVALNKIYNSYIQLFGKFIPTFIFQFLEPSITYFRIPFRAMDTAGV